MKILISGANGFIGAAVKEKLLSRGDEVVALSRSLRAGAIAWPEGAALDGKALEGFDAVIHLAGESVSGRWSEEKKRAIRDSRALRTRELAQALAQTKTSPPAFLCASAIGIYGDRGGEELTENSLPGKGFLAQVGCEWESAAAPMENTSRVAFLRFGIVLGTQGGVLQKLLPVFKMGLGGRVGDGVQFISWISLPDTVSAILHVLDEELSGAFNVTAPHPVRNSEFTKAIARAVQRPALFPVPAWVLRAALGEFADEGLLSSARVLPHRLLESGFAFQHIHLDDALRDLLRK